MGVLTVEVAEAQSRLKDLLEEVARGGEVVLSENNRPVARLVPMQARTPGLHEGASRVSDDFEKPLPEELWEGST